MPDIISLSCCFCPNVWHLSTYSSRKWYLVFCLSCVFCSPLALPLVMLLPLILYTLTNLISDIIVVVCFARLGDIRFIIFLPVLVVVSGHILLSMTYFHSELFGRLLTWHFIRCSRLEPATTRPTSRKTFYIKYVKKPSLSSIFITLYSFIILSVHADCWFP